MVLANMNWLRKLATIGNEINAMAKSVGSAAQPFIIPLIQSHLQNNFRHYSNKQKTKLSRENRDRYQNQGFCGLSFFRFSRPPDNTMDGAALGEKEFREIRAILAGDFFAGGSFYNDQSATSIQ